MKYYFILLYFNIFKKFLFAENRAWKVSETSYPGFQLRVHYWLHVTNKYVHASNLHLNEILVFVQAHSHPFDLYNEFECFSRRWPSIFFKYIYTDWPLPSLPTTKSFNHTKHISISSLLYQQTNSFLSTVSMHSWCSYEKLDKENKPFIIKLKIDL